MIELPQTRFSKRLGARGPVILAPLAGGPCTPELVAAVCNAGGFGFFGGAYLAPDRLEAAIQRLRELTKAPFGVNLFVPHPDPEPSADEIARATAATAGYRRELNLPEPRLTPPFSDDFAAQFEVVLRARPAVFSFTFGLLDRDRLQACRDRGILTFGGATNADEALALERSGVDAVVAQGSEAGGHRFVFSPAAPDPLIGTFGLTRLLASRLRIPIISAGGIMDGRGITAALALGAQAAQLGTAFLACPEAGTSAPYREMLLAAPQPPTRVTRVFSGRAARGLVNRFMEEMESASAALLPFPVQNRLTRDIRREAARQGKSAVLSLWAGQGAPLIRSMPAGELVSTLFSELREAAADRTRDC